MDIYNKILSNVNSAKTQLAVLIDPDKVHNDNIVPLIKTINESGIDFILVGGSLLLDPINSIIKIIKEHAKVPVVLFPGSVLQVSKNVDAILFLSLISGRNPEFLIGNHVQAAPLIKSYGIETIPTGYILIENGKTTSVEYISNTKPIPRSKTDIVVATAIAGEMLGQQLLYLECGSGAEQPVPYEIVEQVKKNVSVPIIVGGGIKQPQEATKLKNAGADILVLGSIIEKEPQLISDFVKAIQ